MTLNRAARLPMLVLILGLAILVRPAAPAAATEVQRVVSPGGIEAWLVHSDAVPVISMAFSFAGGNAADPDGLAGLANLTSYLLDEGAGDLDSAAFQERLAASAIRLSFDDTADRFGGSFRTTTMRADDAFELLRLAVNEPRFDPEPVDRMRAAVLADIRSNVASPRWMAWRSYYDLAYPDHPYRQPSRGTVATVQSIAADDLHAYVDRTFTRDTLVVGVAGDITPDALGQRLDQVFGDLPATGTRPDLPEQAPGAGGLRVLIDRDGAQSQLLMVQPGIRRDDPDYYVAAVLNHILGGGGLNSRLMAEIRQERGLTYGIYSALIQFEATTQWMVAASMAPGNVPEAVEAVTAEIDGIREDGVSTTELQDAITFMTGSFPLSLTTTADIAGLLEAMQVHDLGIDYLDMRNARIAAVTLEQVNALARERLSPEALTIVVAGPPIDGFAPDIVLDAAALQARELSVEPVL